MKKFSMKNFWDERYAEKEFAYGKEPNKFFAEELKKIIPGKILLPAEGEGRNAVFAAKSGWKVVAFDSSTEGRKKALNLAKMAGVSVDYQINSYQDLELPVNTYDCVALIFAHMPGNLRPIIHNKILKSLVPGGIVILEAFSKKQIDYNTGGPRNEEFLFSAEELKEDFFSLSEKMIVETEEDLREGKFHQGKAALVRLLGKK